MTIQEVIAWIQKQQNGQTYLDALNAHLNSLATATKADKATIKKLNDEAKESKSKLDAANSKVEKFADALGVSEDSETLDDDIAAALKAKGTNGDPALQRKIDRLTTQLNTKTKELTEQLNAERAKRHDALVTSALVRDLTEANAMDPAALVEMFRAQVHVGDNDELTFGADSKSIKDGLAGWLKEHPSFVKNTQNGGAGGGNGGNGGGGGNKDDRFTALAKSLAESNKAPESDPAADFFK